MTEQDYAEQAVVGGIIHQNRELGEIWGTLEPQHFSDPLLRRLYAGIASHINRGTPVNVEFVVAEAEGFGIDPGEASRFVTNLVALGQTVSTQNAGLFLYFRQNVLRGMRKTSRLNQSTSPTG